MPLLSTEEMLLGGLAEGLTSGIDTYLKVKQFHDDKERKAQEFETGKRQKQAELAMKATEQGLLYNPNTGEITKGEGYISPKEIQLEKIASNEALRAEQMASRNQMSQMNAEMRRQGLMQAQERIDEGKERRLESDVQKLSDKIGNAQDITNALSNYESKLGFKLDDADVANGQLTVGGKKVDLPGASVPFLGRTSFYSGPARQQQSAMAKIFNVELKDRSGAAVTSPEMERLKTEFASGRFNTEAEMIQAVKDYKRAISDELKNREAGFRPGVVDVYRSRGGRTYRNIDSGQKLNKPQSIPQADWDVLTPLDQLELIKKLGG